MFNFGLLASSSPYIIMVILCAFSYVWMFFGGKPAESDPLAIESCEYATSTLKQASASTYTLDVQNFAKEHHPFCLLNDEKKHFAIFHRLQKYCDTRAEHIISNDYLRSYFSRPPPSIC